MELTLGVIYNLSNFIWRSAKHIGMSKTKNKYDTWRIQNSKCLKSHITVDYFSVLIWEYNTYSLDMTHIFLSPKDNPAVKKKNSFYQFT